MRKSEIAVLIIILASFASAIYLYPLLPATIASHWNELGEVNGYMPKVYALFIMPAVSLLVFLLFLAIPRIDPLKRNIEKFRGYFDGFIVMFTLFLFVLYLLTVFWNFGFTFNIIHVFVLSFGILIFYSGVLLENSKRNWFIGIRTPWTLSSDVVWDKTHKLAGKLFKACGIISLIGFLFERYAFYIILLLIFGAVIYATVYSYVEFKKQNRQTRKQTVKRARKKAIKQVRKKKR
jgi:uncharacterized membrane protein